MRSIIGVLLLLILFPVQNFGQEISSSNISLEFKNFVIQNLILKLRPNDQFKKKYTGYFLLVTISNDGNRNISAATLEDNYEFTLKEIDIDLLKKLNNKFKSTNIEVDPKCLYVFPILIVADTYYEIEDNFEEGIIKSFPNLTFRDFGCINSEKLTVVKVVVRV